MRVLTVGNLYPPHHFGGYEQVWQSRRRSTCATAATSVRVLATDCRHPGVADGEEPGVHRELRWYWRDHDFARPPLPRAACAIERHNHRCSPRHLADLRPDVVASGRWAACRTR